MTTLPAAVQYASVVGMIVTAEADSPTDLDANPDSVPATGKLTFSPTVKLLISSSSKAVISPKPITVDVQPDGSFEAILVANEQADLLPFEWGYTLTFQLTGVTISPITFKVLPGQNVNLVDIVEIPTPSGVDMMRGPAGRGIVSISDPDSGGIATITYSDNTTSQFSIIQVAGGEGGITDHGALLGRSDDDHQQYFNQTRGDARYSLNTHTHDYVPTSRTINNTPLTGDITLNANDVGALPNTYTPPDADWNTLLNKPLTFAPSTHTHDDRYYTEAEADGRFVRTVNNTGPDANGNVTVEGGTGGTSDHGALTGLSDDDHPQYALADGTRGSFAATNHSHAISGVTGLQTALDGKADDGHTHTPDQVGVTDATSSVTGLVRLTGDLGGTATSPTVRSASTTVAGKVELATVTEATTGTDTARAVTPAGLKAVADSKAATTHDHDDRYYTEGEVDTALAGKAAATHDHDGTYQPVGDYAAGTHAHTEYVETTDPRLSDARTPTAHTHDDRYYTEGEVDTALADKADSSHLHAGMVLSVRSPGLNRPTTRTDITVLWIGYEEKPAAFVDSVDLYLSPAVVGGGGDTTAPSTPTGLTTGTITSTSIVLNWNASTDNIGVAGYEVSTNGSSYVNSGSDLTHTFTDLTAETTYDLYVRAYDSAGNRSNAATIQATTVAVAGDTTSPTAPTGLTLGTTTSTSISVTWTASTDNVAVTGYEASTNGTAWTDSGTGLEHTFSGLTASTTYTFYIRAYDAAGNRSTAATIQGTTSASGGTTQHRVLTATTYDITPYNDGSPSIETATSFYIASGILGTASVVGGRVYVPAANAGGSVTIKLWQGAATQPHLPVMSGTPLRTGTVATTVTGWNEVTWSPYLIPNALLPQVWISSTYGNANYQATVLAQEAQIGVAEVPSPTEPDLFLTEKTGGGGSYYATCYRVGTGATAGSATARWYGQDIIVES